MDRCKVMFYVFFDCPLIISTCVRDGFSHKEIKSYCSKNTIHSYVERLTIIIITMNGSCDSDFSGTTDPISQFCFILLMMTFLCSPYDYWFMCLFGVTKYKHFGFILKHAIQQYSHIKAETEMEQKPSWWLYYVCFSRRDAYTTRGQTNS